MEGHGVQTPLIHHDRHVSAVRLAPPVGRRSRVEQTQATGGRGVPGDVAVAEDEHVEVRATGAAAGFASTGVPGLVHHTETHALDVDTSFLVQTIAQRAVIVVAPDRHQPPGALFQFVQQGHIDPVPGMDHHVGTLHCGPHLRRKVTRAFGNVCVSQQEQVGRHPASEQVRPVVNKPLRTGHRCSAGTLFAEPCKGQTPAMTDRQPSSHPRPEDRVLLEGRAGNLYREILHARSCDIAALSEDDREALETLLHLGLVSRERTTVRAVDPALVQSRVVGPISRKAAELQAESAEWARTLSDMSQDYRRTTVAHNPLDEIQGLVNINRFIESVVGDAREELLTAQPAGARKAATLESAVRRDLHALERGVKLRTLYQHSARRSVATREYVDRVTAKGAEVRTLDEFFNRLIVVDRRLAIVPGEQSTKLAVAIHDPHLVAYLVDIFERYWERAHRFTDRQHSTERAVADDVHNMTVRMLVEGHSDNASAKRMGVSTRTYAGYVAALKDEYGVTTRFQLGHTMALRPERPHRPPVPDPEN